VTKTIWKDVIPTSSLCLGKGFCVIERYTENTAENSPKLETCFPIPAGELGRGKAEELARLTSKLGV
jgi:hypothetical protein